MLEICDAWRRHVSESYKKWKTDVWDPADEEEQAVLCKSLEIRMDKEFARETSGQHVKSAGKQFSALVSNDLCIIVCMWATDLTRLATGSGLHIATWKILRSSEQSYILAPMMMAEKVQLSSEVAPGPNSFCKISVSLLRTCLTCSRPVFK
jgi:hypothetical protein